MKKNYLKPLGLYLLGVISTVLFYTSIKSADATAVNYQNRIVSEASFRESIPAICKEDTINYYLENAWGMGEDNCSFGGHKVCLEKTIMDMAYYRLWLKYLPNCFRFVETDSSFHFSDRKIKASDFKKIKELMHEFNSINNLPDTNTNFPYADKKSYAISISKEDISSAIEDFKSQDSTKYKLYSGIRVYLGLDNVNTMKANAINKHLYVVPTYTDNGIEKDYILKKDGQYYVYDLTTPCPAHCDPTSLLNQLKLSN